MLAFFNAYTSYTIEVYMNKEDKIDFDSDILYSSPDLLDYRPDSTIWTDLGLNSAWPKPLSAKLKNKVFS